MTSYKKDGSLLSKTSWKYDQNGYRSEYKYESPNYATSIKLYVNDTKGNNIEEIWGNGRGVIDFKMVRAYDAQGNKIKEVTYKGSSETPHNTSTWRLEYDKNGNWIKRTQSDRNGEDFQIEERMIVYY
jgi:YD repeat-containing protein